MTEKWNAAGGVWGVSVAVAVLRLYCHDSGLLLDSIVCKCVQTEYSSRPLWTLKVWGKNASLVPASAMWE